MINGGQGNKKPKFEITKELRSVVKG